MSTAIPHADLSAAAAPPRALVASLLELGKARLSALVVFTTLTGFVLASGPELALGRLAATLAGTLLSAFAASAFNQCMEVQRDARMLRTCRRPLLTGELSPQVAWGFAVGCAIAGPGLLWAATNLLTAALGALTIVLYVLAYTPLKVVTPANTLVGAVVGGIPPIMGWTAVTGTLDWPAAVLGTILFIWQVPHFLAVAWLYREDYERGGFRMLPSADPTGQRTALIVGWYCILLIPVSVLLSVGGLTGWTYGVGGVLLGLAFLAFGMRMVSRINVRTTRGMFVVSVVYLPLLLGLVMLDRRPHSRNPAPREPSAATQVVAVQAPARASVSAPITAPAAAQTASPVDSKGRP